MNRLISFFSIAFLSGVSANVAGTLAGHVRDPNWYAQYQNQPAGVGYYEYAVNANGAGLTGAAGADDTDVFGAFTMSGLPAGNYTVASWDVWWRSAFVFGVNVPASGSTADVDVRLGATMWGYPAFWDDTSYHEFGQTFVATGPVAMIYVRSASGTIYTMTVHEGGPDGARVGVSRSFGGAGDHRLIFGYGDMPTLAGRTYYVRIRTSSPSVRGNLRQMEPRSDNADPMPGGCLWLGDGTTLTPHPDRDLGLIIMSDDDGLLSNLFARRNGGVFDGVTTVGQTFVARGVGLISAAFWLADPAAPTYVVSIRESGPGGAPVGTVKRGRPARLTADPEMVVTWAPGECPLTAGQTYYVEVSRNGGGAFNQVFINASNPFAYGEAYRNGVAVSGTDLAGTLMEEASDGAATRPEVAFVEYPRVEEPDRFSNKLVVRWTTSVPSDSRVVYAVNHPPYRLTNYLAEPVLEHVVTLPNLQPHALYHFQASSAAPEHRPGVSRDLVSLTRPESPNLLANGDFESTSGPSPSDVIPGWSKGAGLDIKASDGTWFNGIPSHGGTWLAQGAVNGGDADGYLYQRVNGVAPGETYTFSAWITTWMRENGQFKYDVWNEPGRLSYVRLGIDPSGGTNPESAAVRWTPRVYSHLRYHPVAQTVEAAGSAVTVFVRMEGRGGEWHLYGVDDGVLTLTDTPPAPRRAVAESGTTVRLAFTEAVDEGTAEEAEHYAMSDPEMGTTLAVLSAQWLGEGEVRLTTETQLHGTDYFLTVSNVLASGETATRTFLNGMVPVLARVPLVALDESTGWKFESSGQDLGQAWRALEYDDSSWSAGPALLGAAHAMLPEPIRTPLSGGDQTTTYYFRRAFVMPVPLDDWFVHLRQVVDDGVVFYLNGTELHRTGMGDGVVDHATAAARSVGNAVWEGPFEAGPIDLVAGTNVLAAEVHQAEPGGGDVVFGAALEAFAPPSEFIVHAVLRIELAGPNVRLIWKGSRWRLQFALNPQGPWIPLSGARSPYETARTFRTQYFRLIH